MPVLPSFVALLVALAPVGDGKPEVAAPVARVSAQRNEAGTPATAFQTLIFGGGFEEGDLIAWDQFVGRCGTDPQCPTELRFFSLCVADTCEECVDSNDCLNNPTALGPMCVAGGCRCTTDAECVANPAGPVCDVVAGVCTCTADPECSGDATCNPTPYLGGLLTCWGLAAPPQPAYPARALD
jgi:hypothetical protein